MQGFTMYSINTYKLKLMD